jgi:hypothetical protein
VFNGQTKSLVFSLSPLPSPGNDVSIDVSDQNGFIGRFTCLANGDVQQTIAGTAPSLGSSWTITATVTQDAAQEYSTKPADVHFVYTVLPQPLLVMQSHPFIHLTSPNIRIPYKSSSRRRPPSTSSRPAVQGRSDMSAS